jgi:hypothetical protein
MNFVIREDISMLTRVVRICNVANNPFSNMCFWSVLFFCLGHSLIKFRLLADADALDRQTPPIIFCPLLQLFNGRTFGRLPSTHTRRHPGRQAGAVEGPLEQAAKAK